MAVFKPMLSRLAYPITHLPTLSYLSHCTPLFYKRPLDIDDDQLESIQIKSRQTQQQRQQWSDREEDSRFAAGDGDGCGQSASGGGYDNYGKSAGQKDSLHTQTKKDGPTERSINQVILMGRVGADPQIRGTEARPITTFSLATNSVWKTQNPGPGDSEWSNRVDWHNVVVFKPGLRESAYNYVHKVMNSSEEGYSSNSILLQGCRVHITGRLMYGELVDKAGVKRFTTSIACEDIIYLSRKI